MVSSFASQLQAIAKNSTNELDLKARRNAHGESLLFDRDIAVKQDFDTIYSICIGGFRELCQLDQRFHDFDGNLFSEQAKAQDREQMSKTQNEALNLVLKRCITLLGGRILLKPAIKALEWLVRRFRVHVYNVDHLLHSLLPYHEVDIWVNALSIMPSDKIVGQWKFVRPYLQTTWNVPRHAVAYAAAHNDAFYAAINSYVLDACRQGLGHPSLMRFWSGIVVEAVSNRLDQTRSGRKEVQSQRVEDLLHKVLPLLSDGYEIPGNTDLTTTCYTITLVLAAKAGLGDHVLDSLLLAIAQTLSRVDHDSTSAIVVTSVIVTYKEVATLPKKVLDVLAGLEAFDSIVRSVSKQYSCWPLLRCLVISAMLHIKRRNAHKLVVFAEALIHLAYELYPLADLGQLLQPLLAKAISLKPDDESEGSVRSQIVASLQRMNEIDALSTAISDATVSQKHDSAMLESMLGMTVKIPQAALITGTDIEMLDIELTQQPPDDIIGTLPTVWEHEASCLSSRKSATFERLATAFERCYSSDMIEEFSSAKIWSSVSDQPLLWQTFLLRYACSIRGGQSRSRALQLLARNVEKESGSYVQFFVPYTLVLLADVKLIRRSASDFITVLHTILQSDSCKDLESSDSFYGVERAKHVSPITPSQIVSLLADLVLPILEECVLDQTYIIKTMQNALNQTSGHESRKGHRQALFSLLSQHVLATPLMRVKHVVLAMLENVQKVGSKSKAKVLLPILQEWAVCSDSDALELAEESGIAVGDLDAAFVRLTDLHDQQFLEQITISATSSQYRSGLIRALFNYMREDWTTWTVRDQLTAAATLLELAFTQAGAIAAGAQEVLRSVDLPSEVLATILSLSQAGISDVKAPPTKRRRRSSSGTTSSRVEAVKIVDDATANIGLALELVNSNLPELKPELLTSMFDMLATLKQLQQNRIDSPYLVNLCLGSVYAMLQATKGKSVDLSGVKPELVTDCLRNSDNPQVQNTSLLVLASLSSAVPDRMVHNVMPIFTFIGHNMLSKDDEHSINVINEAIDKIVPALLESLRKGKSAQTYQNSMATMLASFTSAYHHIPQHRRVTFYQKLLHCIDANEFGFMLVALLAYQQRAESTLAKFIQDLVSILPSTTQLNIYRQLLDVPVDLFSTSPKISAMIFNVQRSTSAKEKHEYAKSSLIAACTILQAQTLMSNMRHLWRLDQETQELVNSQLLTSFQVTLTTIQSVKHAGNDMASLAKQSLDHLLQLPNLRDLLGLLSSSLDTIQDAELRPQALRILSLQLQTKKGRDVRARELAMGLLNKLKGYLTAESDASLLLATLVCMDRISETYGRKNPDNVVAAAQSLLNYGLCPPGAPEKVQTAVILTIASMIEVVKEAAVPLVLPVLPQIMQVLKLCKTGHTSLFDAACTLLSAVFSNVAFMVSQDQLAEVLVAIMTSSEGQEAPGLPGLVRSISRKVDLQTILGASSVCLGQNNSAELGRVILSLLSQAIEASQRSAVIKQADTISELLLLVLEREAASPQVGDLESTVEASTELKQTSIKFVYKINDTTFRPVFESWIEWANGTSTNNQIVFFDFLTHFFDTLKAIVTSYASYLLKPVSQILRSSISTSKPSSMSTPLPLLQNTLNLLRTILSDDQDAFFTAPSHFEAVAEPLVSCLKLAASKSTRAIVESVVVPAISALTTATLDSPSTHSTLTHYIVQLKSHSSAHVRLASIRTLIALTEDEEVGDDFVANTIGIGAGEGEGARGGGGSVGEIMVYVNEMLEDDDEDVEQNVRKWVQIVRGKVGEDVFEV